MTELIALGSFILATLGIALSQKFQEKRAEKLKAKGKVA